MSSQGTHVLVSRLPNMKTD